MFKKLSEWYKENENKPVSASGVEICIFYFSIIVLIIFVISVWIFDFQWRFLTTFIPLFIWMFLRSSRKDMSATAYLVAGIFGALGGAITVILTKWLERFPH